MPGIKFHHGPGGQLPIPRKRAYLAANSTSYYNGDVVALTQNAGLTANGISVVRPLLAADKTAQYLQGTPVAGILGVINADALTNAYGQATGVPPQGGIANGAGIIYSLPGESAGFGADPNSGRNWINVLLAVPDNYFVGYLASGTATHALDDTPAGLILTTVNGVTTYTIDPTATAAYQCVIIEKPDESDPLYGKANGAVIFSFKGSFCQSLNGVAYTAQ